MAAEERVVRERRIGDVQIIGRRAGLVSHFFTITEYYISHHSSFSSFSLKFNRSNHERITVWKAISLFSIPVEVVLCAIFSFGKQMKGRLSLWLLIARARTTRNCE